MATLIAGCDEQRVVGDLDLVADVKAVEASREGQADRRLLRRPLQNLATNAVRYGNGRVILGAATISGEIHFTIDHDGAGVPEADRERIFQPFVRLDHARTRDGGGVGLGLALVDQIATRHGGRVTVDTSPLGGARFTLVVPSRPLSSERSSIPQQGRIP